MLSPAGCYYEVKLAALSLTLVVAIFPGSLSWAGCVNEEEVFNEEGLGLSCLSWRFGLTLIKIYVKDYVKEEIWSSPVSLPKRLFTHTTRRETP